jgi:GAF domain-containing protein
MAVIDRPAAEAQALSPLAQALLALLAAPDESALAAGLAEHAAALQLPGPAGLHLADGLAVAQRRHRHASLQALQHRILELAVSATGAAAFYSGVHGVIAASTGCSSLHVALLSEDDEWLHFPYAAGPGTLTPPAARPVGRGLAEYVLRIGRPLLVDRTDLAKGAQIEALQACGELEPLDEGLVAWLGVPLVSSDRTLGVLCVQSATPGMVFDARAQELLSAISWPIADGIERQLRRAAERQSAARLEARVKALEAELDRRQR